MKELGIKAQYIKPYIVTTKDSDFNSKLENILNEQFNPTAPNAVWCTAIHICGLMQASCIPYKHYGFILSKNHSLDSFRNFKCFLYH